VTRVIRVNPERPESAAIAAAADVLRSGGLVAFPTETVYGLGAHALDALAVQRIFDAKERPATDPLIVHVASVDDLHQLAADLSPVAETLAGRFWPGPLTLVVRRSAAVPDIVTAGLDTVAVRVPAHPVARALLAASRLPIAAPSANLFSRPSPTRAAHVLEDLDGRVDLVLDGGATTIGIESTVLDLAASPEPVILRPGAVTEEMLRQVVPGVRGAGSALPFRGTGAMRSPGLLSRHYAPRARLTLYEGEPFAIVERITADARHARERGERVGILAADEDPIDAADVVRLGSSADLDRVAARLYDALRELDARGVDRILARAFGGSDGLGAALQDRLRRAASGRIVRC
jgi:L-threonylcarbamoyladenylate synthase